MQNDALYHRRATIKRVYGWDIDYNKSAHENAVAILDKEPKNILTAQN